MHRKVCSLLICILALLCILCPAGLAAEPTALLNTQDLVNNYYYWCTVYGCEIDTTLSAPFSPRPKIGVSSIDKLQISYAFEPYDPSAPLSLLSCMVPIPALHDPVLYPDIYRIQAMICALEYDIDDYRDAESILRAKSESLDIFVQMVSSYLSEPRINGADPILYRSRNAVYHFSPSPLIKGANGALFITATATK